MKRLLLSISLACTMAGAAHAGQHCENKPLAVDEVERSLDLAQRSMQKLDASGAQVAIIARAGQDLSKYGLRYSHVGLAWRDHPAGRWVVVQLLNDCGTAHSALYNDGLGNFFLSGLYQYKAQLILPSPEVQQRLAQVLASRTPQRLHEPKYSMLSYAWSTRYQNSNQWVLETLAAASAAPGRVETRAEAQNWLNQAGFRPSGIDIGLACASAPACSAPTSHSTTIRPARASAATSTLLRWMRSSTSCAATTAARA